MKKEMIKLCVFMAGLLLLQALIGALTLPREIKNFRKYLAGGTECIYFCDSVMKYYTSYDEKADSILDLMKKSNPLFTVEDVEHPGYNADIFYSYCKAIAESKKKPKIIIIPISLYSLSSEWLRPGYKFELERHALKSSSIFNLAFYRVIESLSRNRGNMEQYMELPVYKCETEIGKIRDFDNKTFKVYSEENFKKKIVSRYMYCADEKNEKIQSLKKIAAVMKGSGVQTIFYISPVDYQTCASVYGPEFEENMDRNIAYIKRILSENEGLFLDFSRLLSKGQFVWEETLYINEHLNYSGRLALADVLTERINKMLKEEKR